MPRPAILTAPYAGFGLRIAEQDVRSLQIWVNSDGNGAAYLPVRKKRSVNHVTVLNIPGTALGIMATLMAHGLGFKVLVNNDSSVTSFVSLSNK